MNLGCGRELHDSNNKAELMDSLVQFRVRTGYVGLKGKDHFKALGQHYSIEIYDQQMDSPTCISFFGILVVVPLVLEKFKGNVNK